MQCKLNPPKRHAVEWIASFNDNEFKKLDYKREDYEYVFNVSGESSGILVSYNIEGENYIGAYPVQKYIDAK